MTTNVTIDDIIVLIFSFSVLVEITPIKINPWRWLFGLVGDLLNAGIKTDIQDVKNEIKSVKTELEKHKSEEDASGAKEARRRLFRFNDELLEGKRHSLEHFQDAMRDIDTYELYCATHPEFENNNAVATIENIRYVYKKTMQEKDFSKKEV